MGRKVGQPLTAKRAAALTEPGWHHDRDCLYLWIGKNYGKSWVVRTVVQGKRCDLGLGSFKLVSLAEARDAAHAVRKVARAGGDPRSSRKEALNYEDAAKQAFDARRHLWTDRHANNWWSIQERYVFPAFGRRHLHTIKPDEVYSLLLPMWTQKYDTARRVRQYIGVVFDWATAVGKYSSPNPTNGLSKALPAVGSCREVGGNLRAA